MTLEKFHEKYPFLSKLNEREIHKLLFHVMMWLLEMNMEKDNDKTQLRQFIDDLPRPK